MLDVSYYRAQEQLAMSTCPSRIMFETHNLDVFEKFGFPVRIDNFQQTYMISDSMQEWRFEGYMEELGGLNKKELLELCEVLSLHIGFQERTYVAKNPYIAFDTIFSAFVMYQKIVRLKPKFSTILEIGSGSGGLAFFLSRHAELSQYTQVEACESFYLLQSEIGRFLFGAEFREEVFSRDLSQFFSTVATTKKHYLKRVKNPKASHYPYWKIGEIYETHKEKYDVVTSNANLAEFNPRALSDYLALINHTLKKDGIFFVHCFGSTSINSAKSVYDALYKNGFAPLFFYDYVENMVAQKYGRDIEVFAKSIEGEIVLFPAGEAGLNIAKALKDGGKKVHLCDDFRTGERVENEAILGFDEISQESTIIVTSYDMSILESVRKRAEDRGIRIYTLGDIVAPLRFVVGQGVFVKRENPHFEKYYKKENFSDHFKPLEESAHKAIFMRLDEARKDKKIYSRDEIKEMLLKDRGTANLHKEM